MRAGGGVMRMRWKEHDGKRGELGGKRQEGENKRELQREKR